MSTLFPTVSRPVRFLAAGVTAAGLTAAAATSATSVLSPAQAAPVGASSAASSVAACSNDDVTASYRVTDAGMSHVYGRLVLTNTIAGACSIHGYGGLSYVGDGDGTQIGAAADRTPGKVRTVVLASGEKAVSVVEETSTGPYSKKKCRPTKVDGFRVYVPGATASQFVKHRTTGCRNDAVHLLAHKPFRKVVGH